MTTAKRTGASPFPGPKPYSAEDRGSFRGRRVAASKLASSILAHRCVTLFGPSGAGKSSLMQAAVIPELVEDYDFRVISIDGWPLDERAATWLVDQLYTQLKVGARPREGDPLAQLEEAIERAERRSDRPILIYLDQIEQIMLPSRQSGEFEEFTRCADRIAAHPMRGLQLVLSMREDYLGRFRDYARGRRLLLEHGFRLGPLSVREIVKAVRAAARDGRPPQTWRIDQTRALVLQMRASDQREDEDAEVQAAFVQIVCRALWLARAEPARAPELLAGQDPEGEIQAAPILQAYLDAMLRSLGPLQRAAVELLEQKLITAEGSRRLLTEAEARSSSELDPAALTKVLDTLERASILRAEEHHGSRYFELGHDWLAMKVHEQRRARERLAAERAAAVELTRARAQARSARRVTLIVAALAVLSVLAGSCALYGKRRADEATRGAVAARKLADDLRTKAEQARREAVNDKQQAEREREAAVKAKREAEDAREDAERARRDSEQSRAIAKLAQRHAEQRHQDAVRSGRRARENYRRARVEARRARDATRLAQALGAVRDDPTTMLALLRETESPEDTPGWVPAVVDTLRKPVSQAVLRGHRSGVSTARFSQDGRRVLTASQDRTARLWTWRGVARELRSFDDHVAVVEDARFAPDDARVVTASQDWTARVYELAGPGPARKLAGHRRELLDARFDSRGASVVTTSRDGSVRVWPPEGEPKVLEQPGVSLTAVAVDPTGARIAAGARDGSVRVWSLPAAGAPTRVLRTRAGTVRDLTFSPDGRQLAAVTQGGSVRLWSLNGAGRGRALKGHTREVVSVRYSKDGARLLTASLDGTARVWDVKGERAPVVLGEVGGPRVYSAEFSVDGRRVVTASADGVARIWPTGGARDPIILSGHDEEVMYAEFSNDGRHVVTASRDGTARVWRADGDRGVRELRSHGGRVLEVMFDDSGAWLATRAADRSVLLWPRAGRGQPRALSHPARVVAMRFVDGALLTLDAAGAARRWPLRGGTPRTRATLRHGAKLIAAAISHDGEHAVTSTLEGLRLWSLADARATTLAGHSGTVQSVAFSRDDRRFATGGTDRLALIWRREGAGARVTRALRDHGGAVLSVAFSPSGRLLVTGSYDRKARLWRLASDDSTTVFEGHEGLIRSVRFSSSGERVVTASSDHTLRVWRSRAQPVILRGHTVEVTSAAYSPDELQIASGAADGSVRLWNADFTTSSLHARIERANPVCLTAEQRVRLLGETGEDAAEHAESCQREREQSAPPERRAPAP